MIVIGAGRLAAPGQDVEDDVGGVDVLAQRFRAGRLHRRQPVAQHGGEDVDHLPIAILGAGELAADPVERGRQHPVLERRAVPQRPRLAGQHRHVVPGIEDRLVAAEAAAMLADEPALLAQLDPIGIGADLHRAADGARGDRVAVVVEADQAGLGDRRRHAHGIRRSGRHREPGSAAPPRRPQRPSGRGTRDGDAPWRRRCTRSSSQAFSSS